jgi:hypothetical protein
MKKYKHEWDYKKFCARNLLEFIEMINKYDNELIVFEEASKDISIDTWFDELNHFFNIILQTQAYKHNLICMVFPHVASISNRQKYFIKLGLELIDKIDEPDCHATVFKPTIYTRNFWRLDENDLHYIWWARSNFIKYDNDDLNKAKDYTVWLEGMKAATMEETLTKIRHFYLKMQKKREKMENELKIQEIVQENVCKDNFHLNHKPLW